MTKKRTEELLSKIREEGVVKLEFDQTSRSLRIKKELVDKMNKSNGFVVRTDLTDSVLIFILPQSFNDSVVLDTGHIKNPAEKV